MRSRRHSIVDVSLIATNWLNAFSIFSFQLSPLHVLVIEAFFNGGNKNVFAAAEFSVPANLPHDIGARIKQPIEPVMSFVWVIRRLGGINKFECKLCHSRFTGQKVVVVMHFESTYSSQRVAKCITIQPQELRHEIEILL